MASRVNWTTLITVVVLLFGVWFFFLRGKPPHPDRRNRAILAQISSALKAYKSDFEAYPPSGAVDANGVTWSGSERMVQFLTGYLPDAGKDGMPGDGDPIVTIDDGKQGFGFRLATKGRVYGPYFGTEELDARPESDGSRPSFVDQYRNAVFYYLFDAELRAYRSEDNPGGPKDINAYARNAAGELYRTDFLLLTKGPDGKWDPPRDDRSDDVTNFQD